MQAIEILQHEYALDVLIKPFYFVTTDSDDPFTEINYQFNSLENSKLFGARILFKKNGEIRDVVVIVSDNQEHSSISHGAFFSTPIGGRGYDDFFGIHSK